MVLTHPHLSEAALSQLDLQPQRFPGDLPGILGKALGLGLGCGADVGETVAQAISMFWHRKEQQQGDTWVFRNVMSLPHIFPVNTSPNRPPLP